MRTLQNFIDGAFVDPVEGQTEPVLDILAEAVRHRRAYSYDG